MDVVDPEHKKSLYNNEKILLADPNAKAMIRGKPGWWQMMVGGFFFAHKMGRMVKGTLYLTNKRILFIRDLLKEDEEPTTTKERIRLRKDRELYQHLVGIKDIRVRQPRFGKPEIEVLYKPLSVKAKPFKYRWKVQEPEAKVWVEETKKLLAKAKAPTSEDLRISE
ncbi:MAG: hypothetical protein ACTSW4_05455 [Candidatus Ranarchaeia archaeon]